MAPSDNELYSRLGSIEAKVELVLESLNGLAPRVTVLEAWKSRIMGAAAVCGFFGGLILVPLFKAALKVF